MKRLFLASMLVLLVVIPAAIIAQWQDNGAPVSTGPWHQTYPEITTDNSGGAIVVWMDGRPGSDDDLYAQHIDAWGQPLWAPDGVALCTDSTDQWWPDIVPDGFGGAIVVWEDYRGAGYISDIYAQRVDGNGSPLWTFDGVPVCTATGYQWRQHLVADGTGGAIIVWQDQRVDRQVFAQRVDASGTPLWTTDGVAITNASLESIAPVIAGDGVGGAIIAWEDRTGSYANIFAQRVDALGNLLWPVPGAPVCTLLTHQDQVAIAEDGASGAILAWRDDRDWFTSRTDIYAQRVDPSGNFMWTANGRLVCDAANEQATVRVAPDGIGGGYFAWDDDRSTSTDVYAQWVSPGGGSSWTADGVAVGSVASSQYGRDIDRDGDGVIVTFYNDYGLGEDVYLQRLSSLGALEWGTEGLRITALPAVQYLPRTIVEDGTVITAWQDDRDGFSDIYAQRIDLATTNWGNPQPLIASILDVPGDQGGQVTVNWYSSDWDNAQFQVVSHYSVWRSVVPMSAVSNPAKIGDVFPHLAGVPIVDPATIGPDFEGPALAAMDDFFWQWVVDLPAFFQSGYSYACPTLNDSTSVHDGMHFFKVLAHGFAPFEFWESPPANGYSTDDLAPAGPAMLTATRVAGDVSLTWRPSGENEPDLAQYAIYRSESAGVTPTPGNFVAFATDTAYADDTADPATAYYYVVTAVDVHENESDPTNEAMADIVSGVGTRVPAPDALTLLPNHPNPFSSTTSVRIGLPAGGNVRVEVYDVAGRLVAEQVVTMAEGWRSLSFDGRGHGGKLLPSGVYFYRVSAAGAAVTRKMILMR